MFKESEIRIDHFYNGRGRPRSYRVIPLPTGLSAESPQGKRASHDLVRSLTRQLRDRVVGMCILRDVSGRPFRPVILSLPVLTWNDGAVRKMAQVIYDQRRFSDLPLLADALEEAGCTNGDMLHHCRSGGEHVRGCWVLDLLLGQQ
jgi:hypothetical protein